MGIAIHVADKEDLKPKLRNDKNEQLILRNGKFIMKIQLKTCIH